MYISQFIPKGKSNAISMRGLAYALKTTERDARELVQQARLEGLPICSGATGYYLPAGVKEAEDYYYTQLARAKSGLKVLEPIKRFIDEQRRDWKQLNVTDNDPEVLHDEW